MNWLDNLTHDHALNDVSEDCMSYILESYYMIQDYQTSDVVKTD